FVLRAGERMDAVKYVVTFRKFGRLPASVRDGYLAGRVALLPFPGSLVFWGVGRARQIYPQLPLGLQIPLFANVHRHETPIGIRGPQGGVLQQPTADRPAYENTSGQMRNAYRRTHRWEKVLRDEGELGHARQEAFGRKAVFSTPP